MNILGIYFPEDRPHGLLEEQQAIRDATVEHGHSFVARSVQKVDDVLDVLCYESWRVIHVTDPDDKIMPYLPVPEVLVVPGTELIFFCSCNTLGTAQECISNGTPFAIAPSDTEIFIPAAKPADVLSPQMSKWRMVDGGLMVKGLISDQYCLSFVPIFYAALARGETIEAAFNAARAHCDARFGLKHGRFELLRSGHSFDNIYRSLGESFTPASSSPSMPPTTPTAPTFSDTQAGTAAPANAAADPFSASVVMIGVARMNADETDVGNFQISGTGTIIRADGLILTAWHVVRDVVNPAANVRGLIAMATSWRHMVEIQYEYVVEAYHVGCDAALLRLTQRVRTQTLVQQRISRSFRMLASEPFNAEVSGLRPLALADSDTVGLGDLASVPGFAGVGGWTLTATEGTISGFALESQGQHPPPWFKFASAVNSGQSGAPLVLKGAGVCVGIMNLATRPIRTPGRVHVPISDVGPGQAGPSTRFATRVSNRLVELETCSCSVRDLAEKEPLNWLRPMKTIALYLPQVAPLLQQ